MAGFQFKAMLGGKVGLDQRLALQVLADFDGNFLSSEFALSLANVASQATPVSGLNTLLRQGSLRRAGAQSQFFFYF